MIRFLVAACLALLGVAALLTGPAALTALVLVVAAAVLVELTVLLGRAGARPVLPVALVPGVALPALIAGDVRADAAAGWDRIPGAFAVAVLLGFAAVIVFGRRAGAVAGLSATATASLLVGLGASGIVLLRGLPDGSSWVLALGALVLAADLAGPLVRGLRTARDGDGPAQSTGAVVSPAAALLPGAVAVLAAGVVLWAVIGPPLEPLVLALLGLIALVATLVGGYLQRAVAAAATARGSGSGQGVLLGAVDAILLAAPAGYVLARAVAL